MFSNTPFHFYRSEHWRLLVTIACPFSIRQHSIPSDFMMYRKNSWGIWGFYPDTPAILTSHIFFAARVTYIHLEISDFWRGRVSCILLQPRFQRSCRNPILPTNPHRSQLTGLDHLPHLLFAGLKVGSDLLYREQHHQAHGSSPLF